MAAPSASLVAAVLAHSGRLEKEDLGTRIARLSRRVEELKGEVCNMINKKYNEFLPSMQSAEDLVSQVDSLCSNIDLLKSRIENEFDTAVKDYKTALLEKKYVAAAFHLEKARSSLKTLESRKGFELKVLKALGTELTVQTQNMLYHLGEEWRQMVLWKLPSSKEISGAETVLQMELRLCTMPPKEDQVTGPPVASVLQAFAVLGELHTRLKHFGQLLLKYILKPLIAYPSLRPLLEEQPDTAILRFESAEPNLEHPSPVEVFDKIRLVLEALHKHLLSVSLSECGEDDKNSKVILSEVLGDMIWEEMCDCLIQECLVYSIPASSKKLVQYIEVIKSTEEFEKSLKNMGFLKGDATDLLKYARNVNSHFANKKCQDVIVAARNLMTSEIHNTVKITPDSSIAIPKLPDPGSGDHLKTQKASKTPPNELIHLENETGLSKHTYSMPCCRISVSVEKLMELAYQTLLEATTSTDQCCIQLFYSVRNIFHLFYDVVPTYHKENLQKLPQLAAIHHNNCMYIAHHLLTLGHQFRYRLANILYDGAATFVDLVPGFRRLGMECFLAQMRVQKGEILERLSSAKNFSNMDNEENYSAANKATRQLLHQLKRLGKVWQDVLPVNIYCKAMGTLLNTALSEIISRITALEDISAEDADRLHALGRTMLEEGPLVFTPLLDENKNEKYQEEVPVYVQKWMMFKELMMVLQASLQDIVDRWADGKGPLAAEFSPTEVKSLIRALFQNTERRAAALAKIK
ncbi:centromere/kinetochore protein zw10 homolog isoform X2 [Carettochelys insculpta]|uniref:centromere/kinetochore protein zw10 homolog isoform X2 n=1 Tax=Carettochelys insculpta TaxID=44489 RepID=UPI003EBFC26C